MIGINGAYLERKINEDGSGKFVLGVKDTGISFSNYVKKENGKFVLEHYLSAEDAYLLLNSKKYAEAEAFEDAWSIAYQDAKTHLKTLLSEHFNMGAFSVRDFDKAFKKFEEKSGQLEIGLKKAY